MTSQLLYSSLLLSSTLWLVYSSFLIQAAKCTQDRFPLNILTICTVYVMIVIVFLLFSDSSIMNHYEDIVPILNSPSWHRHRLGSQGSCNQDYDDPSYGGSKSEEYIDDDGANDCSKPFRQEEEFENPLPLSPAGSRRTGCGDQEEKRSQDPRTSGDQGSSKSEGSKTLKFQHDLFESVKDTKKPKVNLEVFKAFIGHPRWHDLAHVQLGDPRWAMAKRVFLPQDVDR